MTDTLSNNKRIAQNTLMLYIRMLLTMGVSLYTVRILLETLGVIDYGLYNVVGGVVTMFSFLSSSLASASQRFFAFELGRNNYVQLKRIFSMNLLIYFILAIIILILAETVGLWFLNNKMTIPDDRMEAAQWVYQFSILSFMMTMFTVPYQAAIIAHERMKIYAYISIIEVSLKLLTVYLLLMISNDQLKTYAILIFVVTSLVTLVYRIYTKRKFKECRFNFYWSKSLFNEIVSYSSWNLFGSLATILKNQGINILLNVFFNPAINAARGIAYQINGAINQFVSNFSIAVKPQIIKSYSSGDYDKMTNLILKSSKYSYFLLFVLSLPFLLETKYILSLWLKEVPNYTVLFTQLVIINTLIDSLSSSLITAAQATGKIKTYQIIVGGTMLLNLPVSYVFLKYQYPPEITMYIAIVIALLNLIARTFMLKGMINFPVLEFYKDVVFKVVLISVLIYFIVIILIKPLLVANDTINFLITTTIAIISSLSIIWSIGFSTSDKGVITNAIRQKLNGIK